MKIFQCAHHVSSSVHGSFSDKESQVHSIGFVYHRLASIWLWESSHPWNPRQICTQTSKIKRLLHVRELSRRLQLFKDQQLPLQFDGNPGVEDSFFIADLGEVYRQFKQNDNSLVQLPAQNDRIEASIGIAYGQT